MPSLDAIVDRLHGKREGSEFRCECPVHQGRSLIAGQKNGTVLVHCQAGCAQDLVIAALQELDLWELSEEDEGGRSPPSGNPSSSSPSSQPEAEYRYYVGAGNLLAIKKRFPMPDGKKRFEWWRPGATKTGLEGKVSQMPLYNAHLVPAEPESLVWFVEGEKAADVCVNNGLLAVSAAGGAAQVDFGDALVILQGRNVVLWPDNDGPGRSLMQRIRSQLDGVAEKVRVIAPKVPEEGDDAADWFAAGHKKEELSTMLAGIRETAWVEQSEDGGFLVSIPDSGGLIRVDFTDISQRFHELSVQMSIWQEIIGEPRTAFATRLNILSPSTKESVRRQVDEMFNRPKGFWTKTLNEAYAVMQKAHADFDPSVVLAEAPDELASGYILRPWVTSDGPAFLFGMGDAGKTFLALIICLVVASGSEFMGEQAVTTKVLYIDYEATAHRLRRRLEALAKGMGIPVPSGIYYWPGRGIPLPEQVASLRKKIVREGIGLVVVDSVAMASGGRAEASEIAVAYMNSLGKLKVPSLSIAHVTKEEGDKWPFGSVVYHNSARLTWNAKRVQEEEENVIHCGLFNRKSNDDKKTAPMALQLLFTVDDQRQPEIITVDREDVTEQFSGDVSLPQRIRAALRPGGRSVKELAEECGAQENQIRARLNGMKDTWRVGQHADGSALWGLKAS